MNRRELLASALATCGLSISDAEPFADKLEAAAEGNEVLEYQMAMLCCMFYNYHRGPRQKQRSPKDFLPRRMTREEIESARRKRNEVLADGFRKLYAKESRHV